ncbi:serine protease gd isoform X2 [Megachile rotundata]|uniref:serine protease gd isoform X2 n=1 Tax=Megachile rotundata TaxID=143995 RepID=UPI000614E434|nr:PREDICTED: serine protease gd-like [Megachile rotundata]XP_012143736.1 PREDICTED: serine protease gd-like [Megachile rotundata]XP_012143737.1 PREDICTED: serine protease gd-like [Megachile rotundata]
MISMIVQVALLMHFLQLIVQVAGQSPCPNYFRYIQDDFTNEVTGFIEIPSPPKGVALHISVSLSIAVALPSKYVGRLELAQSREQSLKAVRQGWPLTYKIRFPLRRPIPVLTGLWFNNQLICSGQRATGPIVTTIVLNHTLYPPGVLPLSEDQGNVIPNYPKTETQPVQPVQPMQPVQPAEPVTPAPTFLEPFSPPNRVNTVLTDTPRPPPNKDSNNLECGRPNNTNKINPLVAGGIKTSPGQWPWLAAIFIVKYDFEFQCAGSLVSNKHIITAAHCFQLNDMNLPVGTLLVTLGRYRLRDWREQGSVNREVAEYKLHPDFNPSGNADADLAVLILRESVEYSVAIKPICLWSGSINLENVVGKAGYVVGWGRDEFGNPYVQEPRQTKAPIVSQEVCLWSNTDFVSFTSNRTFCAGLRNGSGPCNGDSGSGFVMYDNNKDRYFLRGVVSRSLLDGSTMSCDLKQYVVYVDVAKHLDWIKEQIST